MNELLELYRMKKLLGILAWTALFFSLSGITLIVVGSRYRSTKFDLNVPQVIAERNFPIVAGWYDTNETFYTMDIPKITNLGKISGALFAVETNGDWVQVTTITRYHK